MSEYSQRVLQSRKEFIKLVAEQEEEILKIYEEASRQILKELSKVRGDSLSARYLLSLEKSIKRYKRELNNALSKSIKDGIKASSEIASTVPLAYMQAIAPNPKLKQSFVSMFSNLSNDVVKQLVKGNYYADGKTLDQRIWNLTLSNAKDIDMLIKTNIAKGVNAGKLAKELEEYINPNKVLNTKTRVPGIKKDIAYQAQRLARTSLTHANTESYISSCSANPFAEGLKWNLSNSHYSRQVKRFGKDICDEYAGKIFPADKVPLQHCNCLCYFTMETMPIGDARKELISWLNGDFNDKLDKWYNENKEFLGGSI